MVRLLCKQDTKLLWMEDVFTKMTKITPCLEICASYSNESHVVMSITIDTAKLSGQKIITKTGCIVLSFDVVLLHEEHELMYVEKQTYVSEVLDNAVTSKQWRPLWGKVLTTEFNKQRIMTLRNSVSLCTVNPLRMANIIIETIAVWSRPATLRSLARLSLPSAMSENGVSWPLGE